MSIYWFDPTRVVGDGGLVGVASTIGACNLVSSDSTEYRSPDHRIDCVSRKDVLSSLS